MSKAINLESLSIPRGATGNISIRCPECSDSRKKSNAKTLSWNVEKQVGICKHCSESIYVRKATFVPLKIEVSEDFPAPLMAYMSSRGFSLQTLLDCKVGHGREFIHNRQSGIGSTTNVIIFRYFWHGVLRMVKLRDNHKNFAIKKAVDTKPIPYGFDDIKGHKECVWVEGEFDKLAFWEAGIKNCVSVPTGANVSIAEKEHFIKTGSLISENQQNLEYLTECFESFDKMEKIYIATDSDVAGYKLQEELVRRLGKERCYKIKFHKYKYKDAEGVEKSCKDANEMLIHFGKEALARTLDEAEQYPVDGVVFAMDVYSQYKHEFFHGQSKGMPVGFEKLKNHLNLRLGELVVLNGFPNNGKTAFTLQIALYMSLTYGWKWAIYSPENYPITTILGTCVEMLVGNTSDKDNPNRMMFSEAEEALAFIQDHIFFIDNREEDWSHEELRALAKTMVQKLGIAGLIIDPYNAITKDQGLGEGGREDERLNKELSAYVKLGTTYNIIVWINAHPRTAKDQKQLMSAPKVSDLSGGSMFWNKVFIAICIHICNSDDPDNTMVEVHVQKVKNQKLSGIRTDPNSPPCIMFNRKSQRYYEILPSGDKVFPLGKFKLLSKAQPELTFETIEPLTQRVEIDF
jgi:twinkle protein